MRQPLASAVLLVCALHVPAAQAPASGDLPIDITAAELQRRLIEAAGGAAAIAALQTAVSRGTVDIQGLGLQGAFEMIEKAPRRARTRVAFEGGLEMVDGCDGTTAWAQDLTGVRVLEGTALQDALHTCRFLRHVNVPAAYKALTVTGKQRQGDQTVYVVDAVRTDGVTDVLTVDASTYLLASAVVQRTTDGQRAGVPLAFGDYRRVNGVQMPHLLTTVAAGVPVTIRITSVDVNTPIDDALFAAPR